VILLVTSAAFDHWQTDRLPRLGHVDLHCVQLFATAGAIPPLAQESLEGYVMLLSGHFQGFCRDLYTECAQLFAASVPAGMQATIQFQFASGLALNVGNPIVENIRKDFERFGFTLALSAEHPMNAQRITDLGKFNYWRNHVAHQKPTPPPQGTPQTLRLIDIQGWKASCDGLAASLDRIMERELTRILGTPPW
jgi:hypothetical protein